MLFEELKALEGKTILIKYSDGSVWGTLECVANEPPPYGIRLYLKNSVSVQYDPEIHEVFSVEKYINAMLCCGKNDDMDEIKS